MIRQTICTIALIGTLASFDISAMQKPSSADDLDTQSCIHIDTSNIPPLPPQITLVGNIEWLYDTFENDVPVSTTKMSTSYDLLGSTRITSVFSAGYLQEARYNKTLTIYPINIIKAHLAGLKTSPTITHVHTGAYRLIIAVRQQLDGQEHLLFSHVTPVTHLPIHYILESHVPLCETDDMAELIHKITVLAIKS